MSHRRTVIIVASSEAAPTGATQASSNVLLSEGVKVSVEYEVPALLSNEAAAAVVCRILNKLQGELG